MGRRRRKNRGRHRRQSRRGRGQRRGSRRKERRRGKRIENPLYDNESQTTVQKSNPKDGVISLYMTKKLVKSKKWKSHTDISPNLSKKIPSKKKVLPLLNFYNS